MEVAKELIGRGLVREGYSLIYLQQIRDLLADLLVEVRMLAKSGR